MAKIKLGALAQDARGSIAGTTFSKGRYGSYSRQKVSPVQPRTARQLAQRAIFSEASQGWRSLTSAQRAQWDTWAGNHPVVNVFGDAQTLAGNAAYVRVNAMRRTAGIATTAAPPADETPVPNASDAPAVGSTQTVTVTFDAAPATGKYFLVYTTAGKSPGVGFVNSDFRLAATIVGDGSETEFDVIPVDFNDRLAFIAGQIVGVRVVAIGANGVVQSSTLFQPVAS